MRILAFTLCLLSMSCSFKSETSGITGTYSPEFKIFVQRFLDEGRVRGKHFYTGNLSVKFDSRLSGTGIIGMCTRSNSYQEITINPRWWGYIGIEAKEQLMFHELGHCLLFV